jgi:hypothetical protein
VKQRLSSTMVGETLLKRMDASGFLGFDVWEFSARSLRRPYGRLFLTAVVLRHPWRSLAGLSVYGRDVRPARQACIAPVRVSSRAALNAGLAGTDWVVAMGFCEKPMDPLCPAGRFNHRCCVLEQPDRPELPAPCEKCRIRKVACHALAAGATLYIMTSAEDIARDLLFPSLLSPRDRYALISVCPYSVPPLTLAMAICGLHGWVLPYAGGDCPDFTAWARADQGIKLEQTFPSDSAHQRLIGLMRDLAELRSGAGRAAARHFRQSGPVYVPAGVTGS